ncbi:polysaccharide deacetylase family protein [Persephonella sp.]
MVILIVFLLIIGLSYGDILEYKVVRYTFIYNDKRFVSLREFNDGKSVKILAVNVDSLKTDVFNKGIIIEKKFNISDSKYKKLLRKSISDELQNGGIKNGGTDKFFLTVDLCPSSKKEPFELGIIEKFIKKGHKDIGFAVSGRWIIKNQKYLNWIKEKISEGKLKVIWINHSFNHFYDSKLPLDKNFLLKKGTNIEFEILEVEKILLKNGIIPSVFIRYPGLVADYKLRKKVAERYGLIALGSDSWLAKGELPTEGSIILIHGNKNEPKGIKIFEKILERDLEFMSLLDLKP